MASARKGKRSKGSVHLSGPMLECHQILSFLQSKPEATAFLEPVDWEAYGLTDYPEIIQNPMDLGTVQSKLEDGKYRNINEFSADVHLVFENAMRYNRPDSDIYSTAEKLNKLFEKKFSKLKENAKQGTSTTTGKHKTEPEVTRADRLKFSQLVNQLNPDQLGHLVSLLQSSCPDAINEEDDEEIEIEINNIDPQTLLNLNAYAQNAVNQNAENTKRQKTK